jgi:hypothetical protein
VSGHTSFWILRRQRPLTADMGAISSAAAALAVLAFCRPALAQDPYGPGIAPMTGVGPGSGQSEPSAPANAPETHAAPGATDPLLPPGDQPGLPEEPLAIPPRVERRIGSDFRLDELELGRGYPTERDFYGLYYSETSGDYRLRTLFPLWFEREQPSLTDPSITDRASLYGGLYYNRRSAERADDILFPLVWNLRTLTPGNRSRTTIVGPLVNRVTEEGHDNWLAPLYFTGKRQNGGYTLIPPLLTYTSTDGHGGFNLAGPLFCSFKGGSHCDTRSAYDIDFGIAPLYFYGQDHDSRYEVIPPLLHYHSYDDRSLSWLNVWGPYYREHTQTRDMLHLLPLYWSIWGKNERHTTVLPFFHYGRKDDSFLFVNPLYLQSRGEQGENLFVTWGYARYRGRTELDMYTPLFWHYRDRTIGLDQKLLFPFYFTRESPRESTNVYFPFYGNSERFGISETTFVTPFFQHSTHLRGWSTNIHPILYVGRNDQSTHTVVAPFFWDFADPESRATVGFPFYWRFSDRRSVQQLVGNVYYQERKLSSGLDWQIHIFPAFSYGETPDGHWWNVLYGLAGYTRQGETTKIRTLYIPITVSGGE